jgi:hypothetical protein
MLTLPEGGRNRSTADPMAGLATLLKLRSPSNMQSTGDAYGDKRRSQILSGQEDYAPSELDQMTTQLDLGDRGLGVSRDLVRDAGIQHGVEGERVAMQKLQQMLLPAQVKGQYDVQAARENATAASARAQASENAARERAQMTADAVNARQTAGFTQGDKAREDEQAAKAAAAAALAALRAQQGVPAPISKALQDARAGYEGVHPMNSLLRMFGQTPNADTRYEQSLTDVLSRQGALENVQKASALLGRYPGETLDAKLAAMQADPQAPFDVTDLSDYERQYLTLKMGR